MENSPDPDEQIEIPPNIGMDLLTDHDCYIEAALKKLHEKKTNNYG